MGLVARTPRPDVELVEALLDRDEEALAEAIDRYGGVVFGMARRMVAEASLAEEVAQDAFLALWRRPGAFDPDRGSLQAFLVGMTRNKAIDLVRKEESLKRAKNSLIAEVERESTNPSGAEPMLNVDDRHEVQAALAQLSSVQREAIVLAYYGGRTYREVAEELDIPEGTAKTRLRDGLTRLRELISSQRGSGESL